MLRVCARFLFFPAQSRRFRSNFRDETGEITDSVMDGTLTPEEGAKKLSYAAKYRYIE